MKRVIQFCRQEAVLTIAVILAVCSMFVIHPDAGYVSYIDFRTLAILFCLMTIVAGLQKIGIFDRMAEALLEKVNGVTGIVMILVLLCFVLSMFITNDVALITFVPLTIIIMNRMEEQIRKKWLLRCVVMQTIAANLGSMLMPIGNPQNLYLYGKSGMDILSFIRLMLPYTIASLLLLVIWIVFCGGRAAKQSVTVSKAAKSRSFQKEDREFLIVYLILFTLSLLTVAHLLPYPILFVLVLGYTVLRSREILKKIDYALLGTFAALFLFIGNLGRIPQFSEFLEQIMEGREMLTAVAASQVMSNVPAAILLAGFTDQYKALIVGTNLGGLGTLIASMASLISFKYIAKEMPHQKMRYLMEFTAANLVFLACLLVLWNGIK